MSDNAYTAAQIRQLIQTYREQMLKVSEAEGAEWVGRNAARVLDGFSAWFTIADDKVKRALR